MQWQLMKKTMDFKENAEGNVAGYGVKNEKGEMLY